MQWDAMLEDGNKASSTPRPSAWRGASVVRSVTNRVLHDEVPDLVAYPSVVAGTFSLEFLSLPEEVLTTTLIHHRHYFPVETDDGKLKNAFLAVINTEPDNERTIARNASSLPGCAMRGSSGTPIERRRSNRGSIDSPRCCSTRSSEATGRERGGSSGSRVGLPPRLSVPTNRCRDRPPPRHVSRKPI